MRKILVTGANGNLGSCLIKELADHTDYGVIAVGNNKCKINEALDKEGVDNRNKVILLNQDEFYRLENVELFAAVHAAFSRANKSYTDIALSLDYSRNVYRKLMKIGIKRVIYLSSQSVYGSTSEWRKEDSRPAPDTVYSMAKYAGEKLLEAEFADSDIEYSSLRLDYVIQSQKLVPTLCKDAKVKKVINLVGGKQTFSYIDRTDVARAIVSLLNCKRTNVSVYNVGPNRMRFTLIEIANIVKSIAEKHGINDVVINLSESDTELWSGMDSSLFMKDTGWKPSMNILQMVENTFLCT